MFLCCSGTAKTSGATTPTDFNANLGVFRQSNVFTNRRSFSPNWSTSYDISRPWPSVQSYVSLVLLRTHPTLFASHGRFPAVSLRCFLLTPSSARWDYLDNFFIQVVGLGQRFWLGSDHGLAASELVQLRARGFFVSNDNLQLWGSTANQLGVHRVAEMRS